MFGRATVRFVVLDEFGVVVGDADAPQVAWKNAVAEIRRLIARAKRTLGGNYVMPADRGDERSLALVCLLAVFTDKGPPPHQARDSRVLEWLAEEDGVLLSRHMVAEWVAHGWERPPGGEALPAEAFQGLGLVQGWDDELLAIRYCWQEAPVGYDVG